MLKFDRKRDFYKKIILSNLFLNKLIKLEC